jgi:hypothetical protein
MSEPRDFAEELRQLQEDRESRRQATDQDLDNRHADLEQGRAENPNLAAGFTERLTALEDERANWHKANNRTTNNTQRQIVGEMAQTQTDPVAIVNLGNSFQQATASEAFHLVDAPPPPPPVARQ